MLKISLENNIQINKFILINIIGLMDSLEAGLISIEECEICLFSPYSIEKLEKLHLDKRIIDILQRGCELENIYDLLQDKFIDVVKELKNDSQQILKSLSIFDEYKSKAKKIID